MFKKKEFIRLRNELGEGGTVTARGIPSRGSLTAGRFCYRPMDRTKGKGKRIEVGWSSLTVCAIGVGSVVLDVTDVASVFFLFSLHKLETSSKTLLDIFETCLDCTSLFSIDFKAPALNGLPLLFMKYIILSFLE